LKPAPDQNEFPDLPLKPIFWRRGRLYIIDQTQLPFKKIIQEIKTAEEMVSAIQCLAIRGAPALGIAAAYGVVVGLKPYSHAPFQEFLNQFERITSLLIASRPTAVNIRWALEKLRQVLDQSCNDSTSAIWARLDAEARRIHLADLQCSQAIAENGLRLLPRQAKILTHCNTGSLATGGYGTALGIIFKAHQSGYRVQVFVDETRPLLQGARLTAWELEQWGIPFTVITDNMAAYVMQKIGLDAVIVGADRIACNGDTANKIGTLALAIQAAYHGIPFYVSAPFSSVDVGAPNGQAIPIEQRSASEIQHLQGIPIIPATWNTLSPAFDITPAELITAIITEKGIYHHPYHLSEN
jgi:methylthioribose-1-phosphate isomerase